MISALQSREFIFGYPLTVPDLQTINYYFALHPKYFDIDALTNILGHNHKEPITMVINPFLQEFEYGASDKEFWTYDRTVLQLDYCSKIL